MTISICDDDSRELRDIVFLVNEFLQEKKIKGCVREFKNAAGLLEGEKISGGADIYILDIIMPGRSGIDLGKAIRARNKNAFILYLTSSRDFAIDAFSVKAFSYLLKPVSRETIFSELELCFSKIFGAEKKFKVRLKDAIRVLKQSEIIAVEYYGHQLIYHLDGEKIESPKLREPFDVAASEFLCSDFFIKISSSHLLNTQRIKNATNDFFEMDDGSCFKITRKYADAKKRYFDFVLRGGGG